MAKKVTKPADKADQPRELYAPAPKGAKKQLISALGLGNPVTVKANEIIALCKCLEGVAASFDFNRATVSIYVDDPDRCDAINRFAPREIVIGNLSLKIRIFDVSGIEPEEACPPSYTITPAAEIELVKKLFDNCYGGVKYTCAVDQYKTKWHFLEFAGAVIQYQADSLQNPYGFEAKLLIDSIRDFFTLPGGVLISVGRF